MSCTSPPGAAQHVCTRIALSSGAKCVCRAQKQVPKSLNVFGWCTWDAFYWRVSAKGIVDGLQSLHNGGVPPKLLVIDDGALSALSQQCHALCPALLLMPCP